MGDITANSIRNIKISIGTLIILIPFFLYGLNTINNVDDNAENIFKLDSRVEVIETDALTSHDILLELKFNLKKFMEASGEKYISLGNQ